MKNGFFVTCYKNKQKPSFKEITQILQNGFDKQRQKESFDIYTMKIKEKVKEELKQANFKLCLFKNVCNIYFLENLSNVDINTLFKELENKNHKYTHRILIMDIFTVYSQLFNDILRAYIANKVSKTEMDKQSFKILFKQRCSDFDVKSALFESILYEMKRFKVDLDNPNIVIHVQIVKNYIGVYFETRSFFNNELEQKKHN